MFQIKRSDQKTPKTKKYGDSMVPNKNPTKTKAIMFGNKSTVRADMIRFGENIIQQSSSIKYLGTKIINKLKFSSQRNR